VLTGQSIYANTITGAFSIATPLMQATVLTGQSIYANTITGAFSIATPLMQATVLTGQSIYANTITGATSIATPLMQSTVLTGQSIYANTITGAFSIATPLMRATVLTGQSIYANTITGATSIATPLMRATVLTGQSIYGANMYNTSSFEQLLPTQTVQFGYQNNSLSIGNSYFGYQAGQGSNSTTIYSTAIGYQAGQTSQDSYTVAIGYQAGNRNQQTNSIAIGRNAAQSNQSFSAIAIGANAGLFFQRNNAIAIGTNAGQTGQSSANIGQQANAIAIGENAGQFGQKADATAIGENAGQNNQGTGAIAIGANAGNTTQLMDAIAIGTGAGQIGQETDAIAIGFRAGQNTQQLRAIAIGEVAGNQSQGSNAIALGYRSGESSQGSNAVAIGEEAGRTSQGSLAIAIGPSAGHTAQQYRAIAIGFQAGQGMHGTGAIAIGIQAGNTVQGVDCIAIGTESGKTRQTQHSIAIGVQAGQTNQGGGAVALGFQAGRTNQEFYATAIGYASGVDRQGNQTVAVGAFAGEVRQGVGAIAIGNQAGQTGQGANSIVIGNQAGQTGQGANSIAIGQAISCTHANTIVLNPSSTLFTSITANSFYATSLRATNNNDGKLLLYESTNKEIFRNDNVKYSVGVMTIDTNSMNTSFNAGISLINKKSRMSLASDHSAGSNYIDVSGNLHFRDSSSGFRNDLFISPLATPALSNPITVAGDNLICANGVNEFLTLTTESGHTGGIRIGNSDVTIGNNALKINTVSNLTTILNSATIKNLTDNCALRLRPGLNGDVYIQTGTTAGVTTDRDGFREGTSSNIIFSPWYDITSFATINSSGISTRALTASNGITITHGPSGAQTVGGLTISNGTNSSYQYQEGTYSVIRNNNTNGVISFYLGSSNNPFLIEKDVIKANAGITGNQITGNGLTLIAPGKSSVGLFSDRGGSIGNYLDVSGNFHIRDYATSNGDVDIVYLQTSRAGINLGGSGGITNGVINTGVPLVFNSTHWRNRVIRNTHYQLFDKDEINNSAGGVYRGQLYADGNSCLLDMSGSAMTFKVRTTNPTITPLEVSSTGVTCTNITANSVNTTSDYRIKQDVQPITSTEYNVDALNPVCYYNTLSNKTDLGFIAHEVQKTLPILVSGEKDGDSNQSINYTGIIPILVSEIQELKIKVNMLMSKLQELNINTNC
jgi:hypothetical protein